MGKSEVKPSEDTRIYRFNGVEASSVLVGVAGFTIHDVSDSIEWELEQFPNGDQVEYLTLREISKRVKETCRKHSYPEIITVINNGPLDGTLYQYGNHGDNWELYGTTRGYA